MKHQGEIFKQIHPDYSTFGNRVIHEGTPLITTHGGSRYRV